MTAKEASELLWSYTKKLFAGKGAMLKKVYDDPFLENEARAVIHGPGKDLPDSVDHLSVPMQKQVYMFFTEALMFFSIVDPNYQTPGLVDEKMTDSEKLSLLLCDGISCMERRDRSPTPR